ncbi:hypothetical protein BDY24DRAFT_110589 [Mrakia frigida]|uniref:uncharacterized protein n=1 Tax=Mrakia frigida TaxID=29902 RepID=UPI003FCC191B
MPSLLPVPDFRLQSQRTPTRYRGHRRNSFTPLDNAEMIELRARQRTFEGAWQRTALVNLGYGAIVLKVFDRRFFSIGILYTVLSLLLIFISLHRRKESNHSFSDDFPHRWDGESGHPSTSAPPQPPSSTEPTLPPPNDALTNLEGHLSTLPVPIYLSNVTSEPPTTDSPPFSPSSSSPRDATPTTTTTTTGGPLASPPTSKVESGNNPTDPTRRTFGAPFITAGGMVVFFSLAVGLMEIALFVLVMRF